MTLTRFAIELDIPELEDRAADMRRRAERGPRGTGINGGVYVRDEKEIATHRQHNLNLAEACEDLIAMKRKEVDRLL